VILAFGCLGCRPGPASQPSSSEPEAPGPTTILERDATSDVSEAELVFAELEARLLADPPVSGSFRVEVSGALSMALEGEMDLEPMHGRVMATGQVGEDDVELGYYHDGSLLWVQGRDATVNHPHAPELELALIIGFTRMGLAHNLGRFMAGELPDHPSVEISHWVQTRDLALGQGIPGATRALSFSIVVDDQAWGSATLWLADDTGLPVRREQIAQYPSGEIRIVETYDLTANVD
jgi:hypothetical protein